MRTCISAYVFGTYKRFVPLFCYSVVKSYPEYWVKVFVDGELSQGENKSIEEIKTGSPGRIVIQEHAFEDIVLPRIPQLRGGAKKILRWMFESSDFEGFDCVYFSDVDFLILRQSPPLVDFHVRNARRLELPFSNMVREDKSQPGRYAKRLTGLHFVIADPYFERVDPVVRNFKAQPESTEEFLPSDETDESFLYQLVNTSIPFDPNSHYKAPRPLPGLHLAWSRKPLYLERRTGRLTTSQRGEPPLFPDLQDQLKEFANDPVFIRAMWRTRATEAAEILRYLGATPSTRHGPGMLLLLSLQARVARRAALIGSKMGIREGAQTNG